eukprot:scaffold59719_cov17-Tisochrysis_lutea.AAC.1
MAPLLCVSSPFAISSCVMPLVWELVDIDGDTAHCHLAGSTASDVEGLNLKQGMTDKDEKNKFILSFTSCEVRPLVHAANVLGPLSTYLHGLAQYSTPPTAVEHRKLRKGVAQPWIILAPMA